MFSKKENIAQMIKYLREIRLNPVFLVNRSSTLSTHQIHPFAFFFVPAFYAPLGFYARAIHIASSLSSE